MGLNTYGNILNYPNTPPISLGYIFSYPGVGIEEDSNINASSNPTSGRISSSIGNVTLHVSVWYKFPSLAKRVDQ